MKNMKESFIFSLPMYLVGSLPDGQNGYLPWSISHQAEMRPNYMRKNTCQVIQPSTLVLLSAKVTLFPHPRLPLKDCRAKYGTLQSRNL